MKFTTDVKEVPILYIQNRWHYEKNSGHLVDVYARDLCDLPSVSEFVDTLDEDKYHFIEASIRVLNSDDSALALKAITNAFWADFFFTVHHPQANHIFILAAYEKKK